MPITLIVHGGAGAIRDDHVEAHLAGCQAALTAGWALLEAGGSALDACEAAVRVLEDNPIFNAGTGSVLNAAGEVELDAALMDGHTLAYGAVCNLRRIRNPITLARQVLLGPATLLGGVGAEQFAVTQGMALCNNQELVVERERALWQRRRAKHAQPASDSPSAAVPSADQDRTAGHAAPSAGHDTVGAIALDRTGRMVVANSTGGTRFKLPGRIGDTPLVGSGLYADQTVGACVCTGWGETIIRVALARRAVEFLERGLSPQLAAEQAVAVLAHRVSGGSGGCVLLDAHGQIGLAWNTPRMAYAYRVEGGQIISGV